MVKLIRRPKPSVCPAEPSVDLGAPRRLFTRETRCFARGMKLPVVSRDNSNVSVHYMNQFSDGDV